MKGLIKYIKFKLFKYIGEKVYFRKGVLIFFNRIEVDYDIF